jgi:hypothetical protein
MTREPMCFGSLREAKKDASFNKKTFIVMKTPVPVRVKGKLADEDKNRRFVQIAKAMTLSIPPHPITFIGSKGTEVFAVSPVDVFPLSFQ